MGSRRASGEAEIGVAEEWEGDVLALGELALFVRGLSADADHDGSEGGELGEAVAVGAALRRAAAGAGDVVPARGRRLTGNTGPWIDVHDEMSRFPPDVGGKRDVNVGAGRCGQVDRPAQGRGQRQRRQCHSGEVIGGPVVVGDR